jgi:CBS domain-containing protein
MPLKDRLVSGEPDIGPTSGGDAQVRVFSADAIITMPSDATLLAVADELVGDQIGLVVLGSLDHIEGVVSERDLVRAVADGMDPLETRASEIASTKIVSCDVIATVREAAERMMEEYVRHVLLDDNGKVAGIVSARDLLGAYAMALD